MFSTHPDKTDRHACVLEILKGYLATQDRLGGHLHIPALHGLMRHAPGKTFHMTPEIFFQLDGTNQVEFPDSKLTLFPGNICVIPTGLPHSERYRLVHNRFRMLVFMFRNDQIHYHLCVKKNRIQPPQIEHYTCISTQNSQHFIAILHHLTHLIQTKDRWGRIAHDSIGRGIVASLVHMLQKNQPDTKQYSAKISRTLYLIAKNLENPSLGTTILAEQIKCATGYLSAIFHKETGTTLVRYIQQERINKAQALLTYSNMSIKEIAYTCGFNNPDYFRQVFRRIHGTPPSRKRWSVHR